MNSESAAVRHGESTTKRKERMVNGELGMADLKELEYVDSLS